MTPFQRLFSILTKPWIAAAYWGLIVISFIYFDIPVANYFYQLDLRNNFPLLNWVTKFGYGLTYLIGFFILALLFRYLYVKKHWENNVWFLWFCVVIPGLICFFFKVIFSRARPELLITGHLYGFYWLKENAYFWSFPSGHTTTIMGLTFGASNLSPRYAYFFIIPGFLIALSRVLLTYHYLSDVLAATYLAMLEVGLYVCFKQKYGNHSKSMFEISW